MPRIIMLLAGSLLSAAGTSRADGVAVVINELMASNSKTIDDPQWQYDDWIELHNRSDEPVDVGGMYLTDSVAAPTRWRFPTNDPALTTISAGGYLLVWADGDLDEPGLHAAFQLDADGDDIRLLAADAATLVDSVRFGPQRTDVAFGRCPDGSSVWGYLRTATPGRANGEAYVGVVADPAFGHDRGFYSEPFDLEIATATPGATIMYTLNGSRPGQSRGRLYEGLIDVETTTVVRAAAFKAGWLETDVQTHTYLFLQDVIHQPADVPGYPRPWTWLGGSGYGYHDYEMDPEVVNDPAYRDIMVDSLQAIPTLALAADRAAMDTFYWGSGESRVSMELIHPYEPEKDVQTDCGAEPHSHNRMKRSLRLNFRAEFGDARLESSLLQDAPLNGDSATDSFDKLILRGGNNRSWARLWNPAETTYTMDQWYRDTQVALSGIGSRGTFVHLYINGLYWGLYNVVERPDAAFAASYLAGEPEDWYSVSHGGAHGGDSARWDYLKGPLKNKDMSDPDNYAEMQQYLAIDEFIDYVMLSWFVGLSDWPQNNWWGANRNDVPGPFFYFGWDAEWSWETTRGHNNGWVHPDFRSAKSGGATTAALWHALRSNDDFMMRFADRAYRHLFDGGALTDENCQARYLALNDFIRDAVVAESARWGDTCENLGHPTRTRNVDWVLAEAEMLGPGFMADNAARFVASLRREGYYPRIDPPVLVPHGGQVPAGFSLTMTNPNTQGEIYFTLDGSDPRVADLPRQGSSVTLVPETAPAATRYQGPVVLAHSAEVKTRVLDGDVWSALNRATFAVGPVAEGLRITEIMFHPRSTGRPDDPDTEYIELKNVGPGPLNLNLVAFTKGIDFAFGDLVLDSGEHVLVVKDPAAFEAKYGGGHPVAGQYVGSLDNAGERIRLVDAAGEVIHDFRYDDDWYPLTDGKGFSLVVVNPLDPDPGDWGDKGLWRASAYLDGSPGVDD